MVGKHGGMIRRAYKGASDRWGPTKLVDKGLVWFDKALVMQTPHGRNLESQCRRHRMDLQAAQGHQVVRRQELTTADVKWWLKTIMNNKLLTPGHQHHLDHRLWQRHQVGRADPPG